MIVRSKRMRLGAVDPRFRGRLMRAIVGSRLHIDVTGEQSNSDETAYNMLRIEKYVYATRVLIDTYMSYEYMSHHKEGGAKSREDGNGKRGWWKCRILIVTPQTTAAWDKKQS